MDIVGFRRALLGWYERQKRDLPWRQTRDPYRIWVSEIMLQQTRVAAVIPYYERFLERFPTVEVLATARQVVEAAGKLHSDCPSRRQRRMVWPLLLWML